jgi:hypothetical protein
MQIDAKSLRATLTAVKLPVGLVLDEVEISTGPGNIRSKPWELNLEQGGEAVVRVSERSVERFLLQKAPGGLTDIRVKLLTGRALVDASLKVMFMSVQVKAVCRLAVQDRKRLVVELVSADVMGMAPDRMLQNQIDSINPLLDAADLPLDLEIESVEVEAGWIVARGNLKGTPSAH